MRLQHTSFVQSADWTSGPPTYPSDTCVLIRGGAFRTPLPEGIEGSSIPSAIATSQTQFTFAANGLRRGIILVRVLEPIATLIVSGTGYLSLPVDDLYRDVLSDSVLNNVGLARGFQERMCDIGLPLSLQQPHLPRINEDSVAAQLRHRQQDSLEASLGVDPRTCRSEGAVWCSSHWSRSGPSRKPHTGCSRA